ncbi:F-box/LRR-repeat protein At3g26922-like [Bidens hawaiensis]|uniref:F-box/LRR-repeat protein At3g26922-like n=1 Tax=Bidens hawaiensis TaxID=980011 RepID=UPI004048F015
MDSEHNNNITTDMEDDRLSRLPDDLIHKILSFIDFKDAIRTSALSSRWRYIWTSTPYLNFSRNDLFTSHEPSKFVTDVLSHRNNLTGLFSINLSCDQFVFNWFEWEFIKNILNYAFGYNVEELTLQCFHINNIKSPVSLFSSQSLKHLTLSGSSKRRLIMPPSTWELLALTTLHLCYVTFYNDKNDTHIGLFSKCVNLRNLTLGECLMKGAEGFRICHLRLTDLTIIDSSGRLFKGDYPLRFSKYSLHSLEKLDLCIMYPREVDGSKVFGLLQHLHGVKYLTLNLELIELLSSSMKELISRPPSPFANLKSLEEDFYKSLMSIALNGNFTVMYCLLALKVDSNLFETLPLFAVILLAVMFSVSHCSVFVAVVEEEGIIFKEMIWLALALQLVLILSVTVCAMLGVMECNWLEFTARMVVWITM